MRLGLKRHDARLAIGVTLSGLTSLSPAGNASEKTDTMKKYFDSHKISKETGIAGQVQKIIIP
jgi:hypothetical protein